MEELLRDIQKLIERFERERAEVHTCHLPPRYDGRAWDYLPQPPRCCTMKKPSP